ncbi:DAK2 domain-containing protein [Actinomyces naeslundii]|uniref:DAK2 domain-containing protein n=1 Tax=Actinomyces naeslundii TaxID=1655 RepID=A0AA47FHA5_ACTNA|nr:DAK2 domain-containing protein [Actinomyces naeslundii]OMG15168.1 glycerol kinase [Actinomyces naeslundii]PKY94820.1 DAK2 domain-containing protein [Actinomyces naeslundii]WAL42554.1 DAK2 domain-containing protein [Actinomyces naeslundii]
MAQSQGHRPAIPVPGARVLHGPAVRRWIALAEIVADQTRDLVDVLNVFPVPDADTGTNVLLTLRSASDALHRLGWAADAAQVARAAADGAVRGARGNSGLLVSQALAAFADVCADTPDPAGLRPVELVHAYEAMADTTWAAVSRPVAGTLLSVARDAATAARAALEEATASSPATLSVIAAAAAFGSQESVVETAGLGHGPVDAGGAAFMLLLTCLSDTIDAVQDVDPGAAPELRQGDEDADEHAPYTAVARQMLTDLAKGGVPHSVGPEPLGMSTGEFEVMYLLEATAVQAGQLRRDLELIGDSVGVVGTPDALGVGLYQVHVHTDTPRAALPHAGRARQICIHHLHPTALVASTDEPPSPWGALDSDPMGHVVSFERLAARRAERKAKSVRMHPSQAAMPQPAPVEGPRLAARSREAGVGVIACTRAPGLIEQLARSDAAVVLNPDREGIARAAADLGSSQVIVLPCDAACTEAAHDAARFLAARSAVSTVRPPVGKWNAGAARETARAGMQAAAPSERYKSEGIQLLVCDTDDEARVLAATVALAGRSEEDELADLARRAWSAAAGLRTIALNGAQADADAVAHAVASALRPSDELLTVITGRNAGRDVGALAASAAVGARGQVLGEDVEVAVHAGGQERPDVLIAIE